MTADNPEELWHCATPDCPETFAPDEGCFCRECDMTACKTCFEDLHDHISKYGKCTEYDPSDPRI